MTPDFGGLLKRELYLEGAFRNAHSRLRTHAESGGRRQSGVSSPPVCLRVRAACLAAMQRDVVVVGWRRRG